MCIMSTPKPKVEKVAPAPTAQTESDTASVNNRITEDNRRRRAARGAQWASDRAENTMLSSAASTGSKTTLG